MENTQNKGRRGMDMLHGSIADKLFFFAMPIGLMGLFEQLFNSADVFILGRFVGKSAMAAVGNNMPVIGILVMLLMGISLGANVTIAQYLGARRDDKVERTVQTAILMSFGLGALLAVIGELIVYPAFWVLEVPPDVYDMAEQYLRIFLLGLPFLSLYNFEAAIFRSCGDGKTPLYSLVAANMVNIVLDLLSVLVFDFGLAGVVWATVIAFAVNSLILLVLLCRTTDRIRLERHHMRFSREELHHIIRIGLPAGIQGMVFALSNVLIQSALNSLGTEAMAASAAAFIIEGNIYCFVNGFSQATTTFVGQNYGARNLRRCFRITKIAFGVEAAFLLVVTVPVLFFSPELIRLFNGDPNVVGLGDEAPLLRSRDVLPQWHHRHHLRIPARLWIFPAAGCRRPGRYLRRPHHLAVHRICRSPRLPGPHGGLPGQLAGHGHCPDLRLPVLPQAHRPGPAE